MSDDDIAREIAKRDRYRKAIAQQKTPDERMRDMATMQARAWATLLSSPEGYARFLRRNFKARRASQAHLRNDR